MTSPLVPLASNDLLSTAVDKANTVAIGITHVHLTISPCLIRRLEVNRHTFRLEFGVQRIYIFYDKEHNAAEYSIAGE